MNVEADPKELRAAGMVARSVSLASLRLVESTTRNSMALQLMESQLKVHWRWEFAGHEFSAEARQLVARIKFRVEMHRSEAQADSRPVCEIDLTYEIRYTTPSQPIPAEIEKEGLPAFSKWNALYHLWPYVRSEVSHATAAMGLTPFLLPLVTISPTKDVPTESSASAE